MLGFSYTPKTSSDDFLEKLRAKFVWQITYFTCIAITLITAIFWFFAQEYIAHGIITLLISTFCLVLLRSKRLNYKWGANILFLTIVIVQYISTLFFPFDAHFIEAIYVLLVCLFSYLTLGYVWGAVYLVILAILYILYFNFFYITVEDFENIIENESVYGNAYEFIIGMSILIYVMVRHERLNNHAVHLYSLAIEQLKSERNTVKKKNKDTNLLLKEVHSRVKSNLQIVVSLLRLQADDLESEEAKDSFQNAIQRIVTMSIVHQEIFEAQGVEKKGIKNYIESLISNIINTYSTHTEVEYNIDIELDSLHSERTIPLGLILNELITNTIKYAFTNKNEGTINIFISSKENGNFMMTYSDDGQWRENGGESSFGLELIEVFVDQLDGKFERRATEIGTYYLFNLKDKIINNG